MAAVLDDRFGPWTKLLPAWLRRGAAITPHPPRPGAGEPFQNPNPETQNPQGAPWVWPLAVLVTTMFVFISSNPFTWGDPIGRTYLLFDNRRFEMSEQQQHVPSRAVYAVTDRARLVWERSVWNDQFGPSRFGRPIEAVLTAVGAIWLAVLAVRSVRGGITSRSVEFLVFLWLGLLWLGVTLGLGFLLQHYFVPTATIAVLMSGLVVGWSIQLAWNVGRRILAAPSPAVLAPPLRTDTGVSQSGGAS
jgi:hypothetical protein